MRVLTILLAAAMLAGLPGAAQAVTVKAGVDAWQRGDFARAVAIWRPLATRGDADAQFNLGQAYRLGKGVTASSSEAKSWFERSAKAGHLDAQVSLGLLLFDSGERAEALDWLMKAAKRGEPRALLVTGIAMYNGDDVERDPVRAYAHVSRAAAQGLEPAKTTLAEMDSILPLGQRQEGIALALADARGESPQKTAAAPSRIRETGGRLKADDPPAAATPALPKPSTRVATTAPAKPAPKVAKAKPPKAAPKAATPTPAARSGDWRIQLGAFSASGSAEKLYGQLKGKLGSASPYYVAGGNVTRLQVGPYATRAAASKACAALKPRPCFPVKAKR